MEKDADLTRGRAAGRNWGHHNYDVDPLSTAVMSMLWARGFQMKP
jgi:hypothetical protein